MDIRSKASLQQTVKKILNSARPEIWKNEITGHQKNKIPVAATLG
jgi:hypothetical protein